MTPEIVKYSPMAKDSIDMLLQSVADEYPERIFSGNYSRLSDVYDLPCRWYWCAVVDGAVVGTAGIVRFAARDFALKSMFVHKDYRGKEQGTAQRLLEKAEAEAVAQGGEIMWLGTMAQFKAAQKFYLRNGYVEVTREEMPTKCPTNEVDTVFFTKMLR